jgi:hypothetical protein
LLHGAHDMLKPFPLLCLQCYLQSVSNVHRL